MNVHNELGHGFLEGVYQEALAIEFGLMKIPFVREAEIPVIYKGIELQKKFYADFIVFDQIVVELKATDMIVLAHQSQLFNYLNATKLQLALLFNFGTPSLEWKRFSL